MSKCSADEQVRNGYEHEKSKGEQVWLVEKQMRQQNEVEKMNVEQELIQEKDEEL
jgi:hypothetical protein